MSTTPSPGWRERRRRWQRRALTALAVLLIVLGVGVGALAQLMPVIEQHPARVAAWLGERAGQTVAFERLESRWTRRGPLLTLHGLRLGDGDEPLSIGQAQLLVSIYSGLWPGRPLTELRLDGLELQVLRDAQGRWRAEGLGQPGQEPADPQAVFDALEGLGELQVTGARLVVQMQQPRREWTFERVDLRLRVSGRRIRAGLLGYTGQAVQPLTAVVDVDRRSGDGRVAVRADEADLGRWIGAGDGFGVQAVSGRVDLAVDVELSAQHVVAVSGEMSGREIVLAAAPRADDADTTGSVVEAGEPARVEMQRLRVAGAWRAQDGGWQLVVPDLVWQDGVDDWVFGPLTGQGRDGLMAFEAGALPLRPSARLLAVFDRLPSGLRGWMQAAQPRGLVEDARVTVVDGVLAPGHARLQEIGFDAVGERPGVDGLGGVLHFDASGGSLALDADAVDVDWSVAFGEVLTARVEGTLALWREGEGWGLGADPLVVQGEDYDATARVELRFEPDGGRPWLALAADIGQAPVTAANRFWVRHLMPEASVEWLERALVSGTVEGATAVLAGDLDDWPFANGEGVFDSEARLREVELAFDPGWPALTGLHGTAGFTGVGMRVEAGGRLAGAELIRATGTIADWRAAVLRIEADGRGDAGELLGILRASPLQGDYREQIGTLEMAGPARVNLALAIPLGAEGADLSVRGTADLAGVRLADPQWNLEFTQASGRARFTGAGVAAEELSVRLDGQVGSLSLAAGDLTSAENRLVEASLRGRFTARSLLSRVDVLEMLRERIDGEADMTISLRVPQEADGSAGTALLSVRSDLEGVDLDLPAPLRKRPRVSLPLRAEIPLPLEGGEINVRLGGLAHLRGRLTGQGGLVGHIALGQPADPSDGALDLSVTGQVAVLDVAGWAGLATNGLGGEAGATRLGRVDVVAGQLDLLDRAFIETRLQLDPVEDGYRLSIDGPELLGTVSIPDERDRGLVGRFERLYWPAGRPASGEGMDVDPSGVPPLDFEVADLRFGEAVLGEAVLRTYPLLEGMQVERLRATSADMTFDAVGTWSRIDGAAYSRFSLNFSSGNLGRMLASLGYAGLVEGGPTQASIVAGWVGSPAGFGLDVVEGTLSVEVGAGRILEVEPGAGRLLGLVSLTEIPRRLTLDFSDFFGQGFGFNEIRGSFTLGQGLATTDDLRIDGPAAEINVRGSTALQAQTYDQTIEVLPRTGGVLPVVGAITGGPAGAALGAVAQALLNRPFKEATRTLYRVTGPWAAPEVEVIERGPTPRPEEPRSQRGTSSRG